MGIPIRNCRYLGRGWGIILLTGTTFCTCTEFHRKRTERDFNLRKKWHWFFKTSIIHLSSVLKEVHFIIHFHIPFWKSDPIFFLILRFLSIPDNGFAQCTCLPGYVESPNTIRGCVERRQPCEPNVCGAGAVCDPNRAPYCFCPEGTVGNAFKHCGGKHWNNWFFGYMRFILNTFPLRIL